MDSEDEARRHARERDIEIEHTCAKCGFEYACIIVAWYGFEREAQEHYDEHPEGSFCENCRDEEEDER